ncbi:Thioesterase superfamily protein [Euphorbia peplus]|nr:Thioesterase superfamily protein [Euphorbia peplus]
MASSSGTGSTPAADIGDIVRGFFRNVGVSASIPENLEFKDAYSHILTPFLKAENVQRGRISCVFSVVPALANFYKGLHGGALAAIAERVAIACAKTVVPQDKGLFLGELAISYLSAAPKDEVLMVDASVLRSGRNLTVVGMEFRVKKNSKLAFTARATFYNMPLSKL